MNLKLLIESNCGKPGYITFTTVFGLFAGLFGSLYSDNIKNAFPIYWGPYNDFSITALLFWMFFLIFSLLLFFGQKAALKIREGELDKLGLQTEQLGKVLSSLPSKDFLEEFAVIYEISYLAGQKPFNDGDYEREDIEHAIRVVLDGVVALTSKFDGAKNQIFTRNGEANNVIYASNIMLFKASSSLESSELENYSKKIMFCEDEISISQLDGILVLLKELSTTSKTETPEPDSDLQDVILPIPNKIISDDRERYRVLPGAPLAYVQKDMNIYLNTDSLGEWCRIKGDFSSSVCRKVDTYFKETVGDDIRSLVSIPLYLQNTDDKCIGVLNIHRNIEGILASKENAEFFRPLIHPFLCLLVKLISNLENGRKTG